MEIEKMITLSTAHLSEQTRQLLNDDETELVIYPKNGYGWFIYLDKLIQQPNKLPKDLQDCIELAQQMNCTILCFDRDADTTSCLKQYNNI